MAKTHSVAIYTISVRKKKTKEDKDPKSLPVTQKIGKIGSLTDFVDEYCKKYKKEMFSDGKTEKHLQIDTYQKYKTGKYYLDGEVSCGESGLGSTLQHLKTNKKYEKTPEEADLLPFYFCFRQTTDDTKLALCTLRYGNQGIKDQLQKSLASFFNENFKDYVLEIDDHLPAFLKKQFFGNNIVDKIEFTYLEDDIGDISSALESEGRRELKKGRAKVKISLQPTSGVVYGFKQKYIDNPIAALAEMYPKKISIDESKRVGASVTFKNTDGKKRTFSILQEKDILPYVNVSGKVAIDSKRHPVFEDMQKVVTDILVDAKLLLKDGKD